MPRPRNYGERLQELRRIAEVRDLTEAEVAEVKGIADDLLPRARKMLSGFAAQKPNGKAN